MTDQEHCQGTEKPESAFRRFWNKTFRSQKEKIVSGKREEGKTREEDDSPPPYDTLSLNAPPREPIPLLADGTSPANSPDEVVIFGNLSVSSTHRESAAASGFFLRDALRTFQSFPTPEHLKVREFNPDSEAQRLREFLHRQILSEYTFPESITTLYAEDNSYFSCLGQVLYAEWTHRRRFGLHSLSLRLRQDMQRCLRRALYMHVRTLGLREDHIRSILISSFEAARATGLKVSFDPNSCIYSNAVLWKHRRFFVLNDKLACDLKRLDIVAPSRDVDTWELPRGIISVTRQTLFDGSTWSPYRRWVERNNGT